MKQIVGFVVLAALAVGTASADFLDEFSSPALDPGWRIINEDTNYWSLTDRPGFLRIETQFFTSVPVNFFTHVEAIAGNFSVTSKLICHPDSAGQVALIYADYDTLSQMPLAIVGCGNYLGYGTVALAMLGDSISGAFYMDTLIYLRIRVNEDTVFGEYSPDDQNWSIIRSAYNPLFIEHQWSGVMAVNQADLGATPQTPPMNADYDWFRLTGFGAVEEEYSGGLRSISVWPNPFRVAVYIRAGIRGEGLGFRIYDASGKLIKSMSFHSSPSPNPQALKWDGTDQDGRPVPAGVYFARAGGDACAAARIVKIR